ncbi:hypothetical protein [Hydrocarboniclastica marina]|uniref:Uncharacterized protein n=1 Tax=Hydrocarboniclastica marina TaxID=2259620 RepID=A0A4P7XIR2_9ALTE|nr:hypothetical protein [Hydrocarboniclastica marina]QCF26623.1 hypothetical protein soil367_12160 [Hydrocarboniclastica marina]
MAILRLMYFTGVLSLFAATTGASTNEGDNRPQFRAVTAKGCFQSTNIKGDEFLAKGLIDVTIEDPEVIVTAQGEPLEIWTVTYESAVGFDLAKAVVGTHSTRCKSTERRLWIDREDAIELIESERLKELLEREYIRNKDVHEVGIIFRKSDPDSVEFVLQQKNN